ncbi:hypothetical protein Purlil1_347 [Purpureocillium lilacinum]|uniref:Uncharacterized protein n=1 Tax=Purpureocillium lilacinum TaxID=33203 RepID=A0ABR0CI95_PURLI|nr:hypothetical protein Purlil1_347 [Purpureocillium lilacinum]
MAQTYGAPGPIGSSAASAALTQLDAYTRDTRKATGRGVSGGGARYGSGGVESLGGVDNGTDLWPAPGGVVPAPLLHRGTGAWVDMSTSLDMDVWARATGGSERDIMSPRSPSLRCDALPWPGTPWTYKGPTRAAP